MKRLVTIAMIVACAAPSWANGVNGNATSSSDNRGGMNGNGTSSGEWCYDAIPLPAYLRSGIHRVPCWANT